MGVLKKLLRDEAGATAIEYGLIAALIAIACLVAFRMLGLNLATIFETIAAALAGAGRAARCGDMVARVPLRGGADKTAGQAYSRWR